MSWFRLRGWMALYVVAGVFAFDSPTSAHDLYLMDDNHTDYGWNTTPETMDRVMADELDYYLAKITATRDLPATQQIRYGTDCWWYIYNYEHRRSPQQFTTLIAAMQSGHITAPLNPLVELYGAFTTEGAIRAGYYPGRIERLYGVKFQRSQNIENQTSPWGLASLWAESGAEFSWKGICGCATDAPYRDHKTELFRWEGPDGHQLITKWYEFQADDARGGYGEGNLIEAIDDVDRAMAVGKTRDPVTALFGVGHDEISHKSDLFSRLAVEWNAAHDPTDRVLVSNGVDFFESIRPNSATLPVLKGGWGNDWDLWTTSLSRQTSLVRNSFERLRTVEALAALVAWHHPESWKEPRALIDDALINAFKFLEHSWGGKTDAFENILLEDKTQWSASAVRTIDSAEKIVTNEATKLFKTPSTSMREKTLVVFNSLGFLRTDVADVALPPPDRGRQYQVKDSDTGIVVPSQLIQRGGQHFVRFLAADIPSLGYRTYLLSQPQRGKAALTSKASPAAHITKSAMENEMYRAVIGSNGAILSLFDKRAQRPISGPTLYQSSLGVRKNVVAENVGPVSATLRWEVDGTPHSKTFLTFFRDVDRIELTTILDGQVPGIHQHTFNFNFPHPQIRFEEVGAIARPGLMQQDGDFLPGTRADYMTLNHFVAMTQDKYSVVLANADATFMQIGNSTTNTFDLPSHEIKVLAYGDPGKADLPLEVDAIRHQHRFAIASESGSFSGATAMRLGYSLQSPLVVLTPPPSQNGPLQAPSGSLVSIAQQNVVVTAFKPSDDLGHGFVIRFWELDNKPAQVDIDASTLSPEAAIDTTLIETDRSPLTVNHGHISVSVGPNEMKTIRLVPRTPS